MAFAEEVNKEKRLRIGVCGGVAHCPIAGIEISNPQVTPHIGLKSSWGPLGYGAAMTYSFNTDNRRYDPYVSFAFTTFETPDATAMPLSLNYGAYWRISQNLPIFLNFQVGGSYYISAASQEFLSFSLCLRRFVLKWKTTKPV